MNKRIEVHPADRVVIGSAIEFKDACNGRSYCGVVVSCHREDTYARRVWWVVPEFDGVLQKDAVSVAQEEVVRSRDADEWMPIRVEAVGLETSLKLLYSLQLNRGRSRQCESIILDAFFGSVRGRVSARGITE